MTRRRAASLAALAALCAGLAGCGGVGTLQFPTPPTTARAAADTTPTLPPGAAGQPEGTVAGEAATTAPAIGPGGATLDGTVLGPAGPVAGATVLAERLVGDRGATTEAATAADGSWAIRGVLGGRYRVRAWLAPTLALTVPQVLFVGDHDTDTLTLQLTSYTGPVVRTATSPASPVAGEPVNLVVQVTDPTVGEDGVVRPQPAVGVSVALVDGSGWVVTTGDGQAVTGADGRALFEVTCDLVGDDPLAVTVGGSGALPLTLPGCGPPPSTTTTAPSTTTTTTTGSPPGG